MTTQLALFRSLMPEFEHSKDDRVALFLTIAARRVSPAIFTDLTDEATCYLAAHIMATVGNRKVDAAATAGPVTAEKIGNISMSYKPSGSAMAPMDEAFNQTKYGQEFLALRAERVFAPMTTGDV
jgi:hypothetical protein